MHLTHAHAMSRCLIVKCPRLPSVLGGGLNKQDERFAYQIYDLCYAYLYIPHVHFPKHCCCTLASLMHLEKLGLSLTGMHYISEIPPSLNLLQVSMYVRLMSGNILRRCAQVSGWMRCQFAECSTTHGMVIQPG